MGYQYGIVRNVLQLANKQNKTVFVITIVGNDGNTYTKRDTVNPGNVTGRRVSFAIGNGGKNSDGRYSVTGAIKYLRDTRVSGRIARMLSDDSGLIITDNGEKLMFRVSEVNSAAESIYLQQRVSCIPKSLSPDDSSDFAYAADINIEYYEQITDQLADKVFSCLQSSFGSSDISIADAMRCLMDNGINSADYGYENNAEIFLEQFSDKIHIDYDAHTLRLTSMEGCRDLFDDALAELKRQNYPCMTSLQKRVFSDEGFWKNKRLLIMGSTSSGKTAIPVTKYIVDRNRSGERRKMIIAVPLRALATQMKQSLEKKLSGYNLDIAVSTSEYVDRDTDIRHGTVDIAIIIYEKMFVFTADTDSFFQKYDYVVFDEINIFQHNERGAKAEVMNLKLLSGTQNVIMLGTPHHNWGSYIEKYDMYPIKLYSRPTRIHEHFICDRRLYNSSGKIIEANNSCSLETLCGDELCLKHKVIVFTFSQKETRENAKSIFRMLKNRIGVKEHTSEEINAFRKKFLKHHGVSAEELKDVYDKQIEYEALMNGIAFHNASLPESMRTALEKELLDEPEVIPGGLRLVVATDTIAYGLNSNVDTVIMSQMRRHNGMEMNNLTYHEYQNCIGRAGRLGYLNCGCSYAFISGELLNGLDADNRSESIDAAIRYYSSNIVNNEIPASKLGKIIKNTDCNNFAFYMHSLLPYDGKAPTYFSREDIKKTLMRIPNYNHHDEKKGKLDTLIDDAFDFLLKEHMICESCQDDTGFFMGLEDSNEQQYVVTNSGRNFQSVAIGKSSYYLLEKALAALECDGKPCAYLDFFNILCSMEDIMRHFINADPKKQTNANAPYVAALADYFFPIALKKGYISDKLYHDIMDSEAMAKARDGIKLSCEENNMLILVKLVLISGMWLTGYSLNLINSIAGRSNGGIDNIRRKIGEKSSHMIDAVYAKAMAMNMPSQTCAALKRMSKCMFYGINIEWLNSLTDEEIDRLSPQDAANLHIASIYAKRYECMKDGIIPDNEENFWDELSELSDDTKRILQQEGISNG